MTVRMRWRVAIGVKRSSVSCLGTVYQKTGKYAARPVRPLPGYSALLFTALRADPMLKLRAAAVCADAESPLFERQMRPAPAGLAVRMMFCRYAAHVPVLPKSEAIGCKTEHPEPRRGITLLSELPDG